MTEEQIEGLIVDAEARVPAGTDALVLDRLVRSAVETVERYAGPDATVVETFTYGRWERPRTVFTTRPIAAITAITEADVELDPGTDFSVWGERGIVRHNGYWGHSVSVTYDPVVDANLRQQIVLDLVEIEASFRTTDRMQLGDYSEATGDQEARRASVLSRLTEDRALVV
jgi:hypothetical protein